MKRNLLGRATGKRLSAGAAMLAMCMPLAAETASTASTRHVVPATELHEAMQQQAGERADNRATLKHFFTQDLASGVLSKLNLNGTEIRDAVDRLNDDELARLATQAHQAEADFAAGALNNQQITYIIIALATAVIVLILT